MEVIGINKENIKKISEYKKEDSWVYDYRIKSFELFNDLPLPSFGPKYEINFDKIVYYKSNETSIKDNWNNIDKNIKCEFDNLGVTNSEKNLDGIGVQYESEVIYHNMIEE